MAVKNEKKQPSKQTDQAPSDTDRDENLDAKQQAIKYKTFQHIFSQKDIQGGLNEKALTKKLKKSKSLQNSYHNYLKTLEADPTKKFVFPWDSPVRRAFFALLYWGPKSIKWGILLFLLLSVINYTPGPTQHIIEFIFARALYDTTPIRRIPKSLETYTHSANIVDARGAVIKSYGKRQVTLQIPNKVQKALLACEDHYLLPHPNNPWHVNSFFIHSGVSWINILGAIKDSLAGKPRGASTIVMQNAKKILGNTKRSFGEKIEEIIISYMLVSRFGKERNLNFYINTVPVGANIYGFTSAANNYFKKNLAELNYQQLAAIASFIPNHYRQIAFYQIINGKNFTDLDPTKQFHAKSAINKVNLALSYLKDQGEITDAQYRNWLLTDEESIRKIGFRDFHSPLYGEEEWTSWNVIKEVCSRTYRVDDREISGAQLILDEKGDVTIETGVDLVLIEKIKETITDFLSSPHYRRVLKDRNKNTWGKDLERYRQKGMPLPYTDFEGFMGYLYRHLNVGVIIINQEGEIIAYVGGKEFLQKTNGHGDNDSGATKRDIIIDLMNKEATITPSSTIKPIIAYYAMVANNAELENTFVDKPIEYKYVESLGKEVWLPRNWYSYDKNRYLGQKYTLLDAQVISINTIFARLYSNRIISNAMLIGFEDIGLSYNKDDARYWPFGIGASNVPVRQWLGVHNAFLDGYYREPSFVKRIAINGETIYERRHDPENQSIPLFDAKKEREAEMFALYEVCKRGTGAAMKTEFKHRKNLVSGKTGTAPKGRSSLFVSHFNPYSDRSAHKDKTISMLVAVTTNTGGFKSVGTSGQGPVKIAGRIYNYLFQKELRQMMDKKIKKAKGTDSGLANNHLYWANVNRYMDHLLNERCGTDYIYNNITGVDGYQEALEQILNSSNRIYTGRDKLFGKLVDYYCDQDKIVKISPVPSSLNEQN